MEIFTLNKINNLVKRFDDFEVSPSSYSLVAKLLYEANHRMKKAEKYNSKAIRETVLELEKRKIALLYRLKRSLINEKSLKHEELREKLNRELVSWVKEYPGFNPDHHDHNPERKIEELCYSYPLYADLVLRDKKTRRNFFKWAVRDNNNVAPFVLFPYLQKKLMECNFSQRIGHNKGKDLKIFSKENELGENFPYLAFPIEGVDVDIANSDTKVQIGDGSARTIQDIFDIFQYKVKHPGDLEFFPGVGVKYWPSYEPWKVMNFDKPNFWLDAPPLKTASPEELRRRYGNTVPGKDFEEVWLRKEELIKSKDPKIPDKNLYWFENDTFLFNEVTPLKFEEDRIKVRRRERIPIDGKNFVLIFRATKQNDMSLLRTHSFSEVWIPLEDRKYMVFNDGKYPKHYPTKDLQLLYEFVNVVPAALQIVDDNYFFNHRNHTYECLGLLPHEGKMLLEIKRFLMKLARDDKLGFEFQTEGCAKMVQVDLLKSLLVILEEQTYSPELAAKKISEILYTDALEEYDQTHPPNLFWTSLELINPEGFFGVVFSTIKKFPRKWQPYLVTLVYTLLGFWRGITLSIGGRNVKLSHKNSPCFMDGTDYHHSLYHPGYMHLQQEEKGISLLKRKLKAVKLPEV